MEGILTISHQLTAAEILKMHPDEVKAFVVSLVSTGMGQAIVEKHEIEYRKDLETGDRVYRLQVAVLSTERYQELLEIEKETLLPEEHVH